MLEEEMNRAIQRAIIQLAIAAYGSRCKRLGFIYQQPSEACSEMKGDVVVLRNGYGKLGRCWLNEVGHEQYQFERIKEGAP